VKTGAVSDLQANCSDSTKEDREFDDVGLKRSFVAYERCMCYCTGA